MARQRWEPAALDLAALRIVLGFIYWGGGSRRLLYAPQKLDPHAASWMGNKLQSAIPGALLGTGQAIAFLVHHFTLLYSSLVLFSAAELVFGLMLIMGVLTRLAATIFILLSILLMLTFGWQGATCIDEWTMAASNLAMSVAIVLAGGGAFALDIVIARRMPRLAGRGWFGWLSGDAPLSSDRHGGLGIAAALLAFTVAFTTGTYSYYRGGVVTAYHGGTVSPAKHYLTLTNGAILPDGSVQFHISEDGGTAAVPAYILQTIIRRTGGAVVAQWNAKALSALPNSAILNDFPYQVIKTGKFGRSAAVGATATIVLPPAGVRPAPGDTRRITTASGTSFQALLANQANS